MNDKMPLWRPNVRYRKQMGGRITLVNGVDVYQLDEIPNLIWSICDGKHTVHDIAASITEQYDIDSSTALEDCQGFLNEMDQSKLISWV